MLKRHAVTFAAALALAGCAAEPTPVLLESTDLRLPLDEYLLSPDELRELSRARVVRARECMGDAGFDFPPAEEPADAGLRSWNERRYGITDADLAATHGYGLGVPPPRPRPEPTPDQRAALDACIVRIEAPQRRDVDRELPLRLATESFTRSRGAPRVRAVFESWSACMRNKGYDYADPLAAVSAAPAEPVVALTDIECKRTTNLVGVWFTEERAIQRDLVAANRSALAKVRHANAAELGQARQVVGP